MKRGNRVLLWALTWAWIVGGTACSRRTVPTHPAAGKTVEGDLSAEVEAGEFDWPQYRGPSRDGTTPETGWDSTWSGAPPTLWEKELGTGASSVAVKGGRLFTLGNKADEDTVFCLVARTGKEIWRFSYPCSLAARQFEGGPAATPTVDEGRVYTLSHEGQLFCLDALNGSSIWALHLVRDLGCERPQWGYAGSVLVVDGRVIVDAGGGGCSTVALEKGTGQVAWKAGSDQAGYGSPVSFQFRGEPALLIFKGKALVAQSLANGEELWRRPWETSYDVNAATPIVSGNRAFIASGYGRGCAVLDFGSGRPEVVWESKVMRNHFNSCLLHENHIYGPDDSGRLKCIDFETGEVKWESRGFGKGAVILAGDKLLGCSERGTIIAAEAAPGEYRELSRADVLDDRCWVSPALANGLAYVRDNEGRLICLDLRS